MTEPSPNATSTHALSANKSRRSQAIFIVMLTAPLMLIPGFLWVQWMAVKLHPEVIGRWHLTLSGSLNNDRISGPFSVLLIFATPFLLTAIWLAIRYYWAFTPHVRSKTGRSHPLFWSCYVAMAGVLQLVAATGMLMVAYFPSHSHSDMHVAGSYMLFSGHAISIGMSGYFSLRLSQNDVFDLGAKWLGREKWRWKLSLGVVGIAIVYPFLFYAPSVHNTLRFYEFSVLVAATEVIMLIAFLLYLFSFTPEVMGFDNARRNQNA